MDGRRNGYSDFLNANNQKSELHGGNQYSSIQREASEIQTPKSTYFLVFATSTYKYTIVQNYFYLSF
jgi:hypothetical protein